MQPTDPPALTIVSGGQTGVDRGALDAALALGWPCGGWVPEGRRAEDGEIPERYPLSVLPGADNDARTARNVADADATLVIAFGEPVGGTRTTLECCRRLGRPHLLVDALARAPADAAREVAELVRAWNVSVLNVAGPRASEASGGEAYARSVILALAALLGQAPA